MDEATTKLKESLQQTGWYLTKEGIDICKEDLGSKSDRASMKDIINAALNIDLSLIGGKVLPDDLSKGKLNKFNGPCVLQVIKVRNASAPKVNEESSVAPRMLQIHLSDGHKTCTAVEHSNIGKELSINTPPGSKVSLNGCIKVQNGYLLLNSDNVQCLGGKVESLYNKWKTAKDASGFFRNVTEGDDAPPSFVPFGKKIDYQCNTSNPSLQNSNIKGDNDEDNKGFSEQRETAIAKVKQSMGDSSTKSFTAARNKPDQESSGNSNRYEDRPNRRDFGRGQSRSDNYRKPGNVRADEDKVAQIVQMGFSRPAAIGTLRRHDNNLEQALESLLQSSSDNPRNDSRGRRGNDRSRGGKRSNRDGKFDRNDDSSHHTSSSTLFDFVETKFTRNAQKAKSQENAKSPTSEHNKSQPPDDDDALQEQYLVEYAKELSLVETHGSNQQYQLHEEPRCSEVNPENRGVSKYRDGGSRRAARNNRRDNDFDNGNYQSNRTNPDQTGSNRFSKSDKQEPRQYNSNRNRDDYSRSNGPSRARQPRNNDWKPRSEESVEFSKPLYYNEEDSSDRDLRKDFSKNDHGDDRPYRNETNRNRTRNSTESKVPPRFQKKKEQRDARRPTSSQSRDLGNKRNVTLGDTNQQRKSDSPVGSEHMYPVYDSQKSPDRLKPLSSHSYQDQRQQSRPIAGERAQYNSYTEDIGGRWAPGMTCQALYWEDGQYYRATVMNVHPTEPTAVVEFVGYGNNEEVLFKDMRPDTIKPLLSGHGTYTGPTGGLEFRRGHKGPTRYPKERERRTPLRPSKTLYQPPVPSK